MPAQEITVETRFRFWLLDDEEDLARCGREICSTLGQPYCYIVQGFWFNESFRLSLEIKSDNPHNPIQGGIGLIGILTGTRPEIITHAEFTDRYGLDARTLGAEQ